MMQSARYSKQARRWRQVNRAAWLAVMGVALALVLGGASADPVECYTEQDMRYLERLVLASQREYLEARGD